MSTISASTTTTTAYVVTADTTGALVLQTGATPTTALTIDTSQNVGIGTASPAYKFQVSNSVGYGQVAIQGTAASGGIINFYDAASVVTSRILGFGSTAGSPDAYALRFDTNSSERMRIDSSGNVGIGVTPSAWSGQTALQNSAGSLSSSTTTSLNLAQNAYYNGTSWIRTNALAATLLQQNGGAFNFFNAASSTAGSTISFTQAMNLDASGNLGIGDTAANADGSKLYVYGNVPASTQYGIKIGGNANTYTQQAIRFYDTYNTAYAGFIGFTTSALTFGSGTTEAMRITSAKQIQLTNSDSLQVNSLKASRFGYSSSYQTVILGSSTGNVTPCINVDLSANNSGSFTGTGGEVAFRNDTIFIQPTSANTGILNSMRLNNGNVQVYGALSKGSGSFRIDHPLAEKTATHELVHSFIEGPQADLIYRGKVNLVAGTATVNVDTASTMTEGTFVALCRDVQCFTTNESDWTPVRGSVTGNILTIEAQDNTSTASISWMVIGERQDKHMQETNWTDENGKVIVEPTKTIEKTAGDK